PRVRRGSGGGPEAKLAAGSRVSNLGSWFCRGRELAQPGLGLVENPLHGPVVLVLAVEPDHRLGPREPLEQPPPIPQRVLAAVEVTDGGAGLAGRRGRCPVAGVGDESAHRLDGQGDVAPPVGEATELRGELVERLSQAAARLREALDEEQRGKNAVAL